MSERPEAGRDTVERQKALVKDVRLAIFASLVFSEPQRADGLVDITAGRDMSEMLDNVAELIGIYSKASKSAIGKEWRNLLRGVNKDLKRMPAEARRETIKAALTVEEAPGSKPSAEDQDFANVVTIYEHKGLACLRFNQNAYDQIICAQTEVTELEEHFASLHAGAPAPTEEAQAEEDQPALV